MSGCTSCCSQAQLAPCWWLGMRHCGLHLGRGWTPQTPASLAYGCACCVVGLLVAQIFVNFCWLCSPYTELWHATPGACTSLVGASCGVAIPVYFQAQLSSQGCVNSGEILPIQACHQGLALSSNNRGCKRPIYSNKGPAMCSLKPAFQWWSYICHQSCIVKVVTFLVSIVFLL